MDNFSSLVLQLGATLLVAVLSVFAGRESLLLITSTGGKVNALLAFAFSAVVASIAVEETWWVFCAAAVGGFVGWIIAFHMVEGRARPGRPGGREPESGGGG